MSDKRNNCLCYLIIFVIIIGGIYAWSVLSSPTDDNGNGGIPPPDATQTTDTTTGETTTTTTTEPLRTYTFKTKWRYEPKMQIDPPAWVLVELYTNDAAEEYRDGVYVFVQEQWYDGVYLYEFTEGDTFRVYIGDSAGWNFEPDGGSYAVVTAGIETEFDLMASGDDWGTIWIDWELV